jgi:hypothetical protein
MAKEGNIQDNARSYKSKIGGMRIILRNRMHHEDFVKFLKKRGKQRYIECYQELLKVKQHTDVETLLREISKLFLKYPTEGMFIWDKNILVIGTCLEPLRFNKDEELTTAAIIKNILWVEETLLSKVTLDFEEFISTREFAKRGSIALEGPLHASLSHSQSQKDAQVRGPSLVPETSKEHKIGE